MSAYVLESTQDAQCTNAWVAGRSRRVLGLCAAVAAASLGMTALGIRFNHTESVPRGFYRTRAFVRSEVARGTYVCVRASSDAAPLALRASGWGARGETLLKRVAGVPGDLVTLAADGSIAIGGELLEHSQRRATDLRGNPLARPVLPRELGGTELWLSSSRAEGYDSRYFGPVSMAAIGCIAEPLWTF